MPETTSPPAEVSSLVSIGEVCRSWYCSFRRWWLVRFDLGRPAGAFPRRRRCWPCFCGPPCFAFCLAPCLDLLPCFAPWCCAAGWCSPCCCAFALEFVFAFEPDPRRRRERRRFRVEPPPPVRPSPAGRFCSPWDAPRDAAAPGAGRVLSVIRSIVTASPAVVVFFGLLAGGVAGVSWYG